MSEYFDTFFINPKLALKVAKQQNKVKLYNGMGTQLCYYSGKEIKNIPENMIQMPIENMKVFFNNNSYRLPEYIDFNKSAYANDDDLQVNYKNVLLSLFKEIKNAEKEKNEILLEKLKSQNNTLFNKQCINFVIIVSRVLEYDFFYAKQLKKSLKSLGHTITILTESGSKNTLLNNLKTNFILEKLHTIKPNVIVFINDYKPDIVPDNTYQISIINGFIPLLTSMKKDDLRKKDILVSQNQYIGKLLEDKNISLNMINPVVQCKDKPSQYKTKKNKLIIFGHYFNLNDYILFQNMTKDFFKKINSETLSMTKILKYLDDNNYDNKNDYEMMLYLQKNIILQSCLQWIDSPNNNIVVFGENWNKFKKLSSNIKTKSAKNPRKEYRKAEYILHISSNIIDINLLEILKENAIPVIYDLRKEDKNYQNKFDDYCLFFKNQEELNHILNNNLKPKKVFSKDLLKDYSFDSLSKELESLILNPNDN